MNSTRLTTEERQALNALRRWFISMSLRNLGHLKTATKNWIRADNKEEAPDV